MFRFVAFSFAILTLINAHPASADLFADRAQAAHDQSAQDAEIQRARYQVSSQLAFKKQINIFAKKHAGFADAGRCTSGYSTTCTLFAICVPKLEVGLSVSQLGVAGYDAEYCEVNFRDGMACRISDKGGPDWMEYNTSDGRQPVLEADCYDSKNVEHFLKQY